MSLSPFKYVLLFIGMSFSVLACAEEEKSQKTYVAGTHYDVLPVAVPTRNPEKIEVVELFWYGCPHCYNFDPVLQKWVKDLPDHVDFWHSPAAFNDTWKLHAQAYYTFKALNIDEKMHQPFFDALVKERRQLNSPEAIADFVAAQGGDRDQFLKAFHSFSVKSQTAQAEKRGMSYRATGVPALVVNGKYRIASTVPGGFEAMLDIADFLIAKERKAAEKKGS